MQTIEITTELAEVAQEFAMSKYATQMHRDAAILEHLVTARKECQRLQRENAELREILNGEPHH